MAVKRISQMSDAEYKKLCLERRRTYRRKMLVIRAVSVLLIVLVCVLTVHAFSVKASAQDTKPSFKYYTQVTVSAGETLSDIAADFMDEEHYSEASYREEVLSINHLSDDASLRSGMVLIVPYYSTDYIAY